MKPDDLSERVLDFAARTGNVVDALPDTRLGRHIAKQYIRSGTAAGPNYEEGRAAESRAPRFWNCPYWIDTSLS